MSYLRALLTASLAIGAAACAAQTSGPVDDYAALVAACGKPVSVTSQRVAAGGPHAVNRDVKYPRLEFLLMKNDAEAWTTIGVFRLHHDDTLDRSEAEAVMPCLRNDRNPYPLETAATAQVPTATTPASIRSGSDDVPALATAMLIGVCALYFLPILIANSRRVEKSGGIFAVNLFLGWTLIGWVGALAWACSAETKDQLAARATDRQLLNQLLAERNRPS